MKYVGYVTSWLVVIVVGSIFYGFALAILWGWFVVPALHAPSLTIPQSIGLSQVVSLFTYRSTSSSESKDQERAGDLLMRASVVAIITPLIFLLFGFIVHLFV